MKIVGIVVLFVAFIALFALVAAIPLYFLWNWLMPELFGLKTITVPQSFGLVFLSSLLFKSSSFSSSK